MRVQEITLTDGTIRITYQPGSESVSVATTGTVHVTTSEEFLKLFAALVLAKRESFLYY